MKDKKNQLCSRYQHSTRISQSRNSIIKNQKRMMDSGHRMQTLMSELASLVSIRSHVRQLLNNNREMPITINSLPTTNSTIKMINWSFRVITTATMKNLNQQSKSLLILPIHLTWTRQPSIPIPKLKQEEDQPNKEHNSRSKWSAQEYKCLEVIKINKGICSSNAVSRTGSSINKSSSKLSQWRTSKTKEYTSRQPTSNQVFLAEKLRCLRMNGRVSRRRLILNMKRSLRASAMKPWRSSRPMRKSTRHFWKRPNICLIKVELKENRAIKKAHTRLSKATREDQKGVKEQIETDSSHQRQLKHKPK